VSRAFVKEGYGDEALPLALPPGVPNAITADGAARWQAQPAAWRAERRALGDPGGGSGLAAGRRRELDGLIGAWEARSATFRVSGPPARPERVSFSCTVELDGPRGPRRYRVVGVDGVRGDGYASWLFPFG